MIVNINDHQQWYYTTGDGEKHGPVSIAAIQELALCNRLPEATALLWAEGMTDWVSVGNIAGLIQTGNSIASANDVENIPDIPLETPQEPAGLPTSFPDFHKRLFAFLIDMVFCNVGIIIVILIFDIDTMDMMNLLSVGVVWLYFTLQESSAAQATLGKKWMGIKVCDDQNNKLSFLHATGRHVGKLLSGILLVGFIMARFTKKKQALHDLLAKTFVVNA